MKRSGQTQLLYYYKIIRKGWSPLSWKWRDDHLPPWERSFWCILKPLDAFWSSMMQSEAVWANTITILLQDNRERMVTTLLKRKGWPPPSPFLKPSDAIWSSLKHCEEFWSIMKRPGQTQLLYYYKIIRNGWSPLSWKWRDDHLPP